MSQCCSSGASKKPSSCSVDSAKEPVKAKSAAQTSCCDSSDKSFDWMLWGGFFCVGILYGLHTIVGSLGIGVLDTTAHAVVELFNTMWWSVLLAVVFVGLIGQIPQAFIVSILGRGGSFQGVLRATAAGVLMDLCSHGILMVGMKLYKKGASLGQVMAFLIASPWNSISLTLIMLALIGWFWTLAFIFLSMVLAVISGVIFDRLVAKNTLPANPHLADLPEGFCFWPEARKSWGNTQLNGAWFGSVAREGIQGSRIVVRWLLVGILLAAAIRGFVDLDSFQTYFGPTVLGLGLTLLAATVIEVCSEGSMPVAADLMTRGNAPGNSFSFLMAGIATDYTEVMVIKDTMSSWKVALFLPLVVVPQVIVVALILNNFS